VFLLEIELYQRLKAFFFDCVTIFLLFEKTQRIAIVDRRSKNPRLGNKAKPYKNYRKVARKDFGLFYKIFQFKIHFSFFC